MTKKRICLNMIVKNESAVIQRCLDSVKPFIDYWVIVDTGSNDGTQGIIKGSLRDIPGDLYERPWRDFAHNRGEALALAKGKADVILFIDADEVFTTTLTTLSLDMDFATIELQLEKGTVGHRMFLVDAALDWRWRGVIHEELVSSAPRKGGVLSSSKLHIYRDGNRSLDPFKFQKEAMVLEEALLHESENGRYRFYLARAYELNHEYEKALVAYQQRSRMPGTEEELFYSLYRIGWLQEQLKRPSSEIRESLTHAYLSRPSRAEPLSCLASHLLESNEVLAAHAMLLFALKIPFPANDVIFVERSVYDYQLLTKLADCTCLMQHYDKTQIIMQGLLCNPALPLNLTAKIKHIFPEIERRATLCNRQSA